GIGQKVLNDSPALGRFVVGKERFARDPTVPEGEVPTSALVPQANKDVDTVIFHVERLAAPLYSVAEDRDGFLAKDRLDSLGRIVGSFDDGFRAAADLDAAHCVVL